MHRNSHRVWPVQCANGFQHKIELLWGLWRRHVTQWDVPAIFGLDPFGRTVDDVIRDKRGEGISGRFLRSIMLPAEMAIGEAAAGIERSYVAWLSHTVEPLSALGVIGHTQTHHKRRNSTIIVPMRVPYALTSDEGRAAGWDLPSGLESAARVPKFARAVGEFVAAISMTRNIALAVMQPDLRIVRYPWTPDPMVGHGIVMKCRQWHAASMGGRESVSPKSPLEAAPAASMEADDAMLASVDRLADVRAQILALQHTEAVLSQELLDAMGDCSHLRHPSTAKLIAVVEPAQAMIAVPRAEAASFAHAASRSVVLSETEASIKVIR